ncbi:hypothetical protein Taro_016562 [Colocasia esculenta]|uniref:Uncharacterized protein n=1 Tax=Colocasia esculenta TaxID=4460 RepID=A0A843UP28_COLES|nr:hypothetical protein [Colocasia esculenta]
MLSGKEPPEALCKTSSSREEDLSGDVPVSTKEKIGLITLRRSHYSLVGKKQNLCVQIKTPAVPAISDVFVQPPEPIVEQVAQPVIPPEVPSADVQLPASSSLPEQDAPSETVHEVLKDLRVVIYHPPEEQQQQQQQQESVADQQPAAAAEEEEVSLGKRPLEASLEVHTFKRKVKKRLIKNGNPICPSPSSRPSSPAPPIINPPETTPTAPSSTAPSASVLEVSIPDLQFVSQKSHYLTPQEFVDLYPEEAMRFQEAQSRNHHLKIYTHISLQFHDLFATLLRESQAKFTAMKAFNFERFKLGLHDVSRGQYDMLIRGQRPVVPSMTTALLPDLHPPLVGAVLYKGTFANTLYNRFLRISKRFKIKYKSKLSFQRFILLHIPKFQKNLLDLQLSFAESERFTPAQWEKAYPDHHAQCQKMKLTLNEYHSKSLLDLRKQIGLKWAHRYLYYYQAKDAALSIGLHWNITLHEFLSLAATKKFTPLQIKYVMDPDKANLKRAFYRRRHTKSVKNYLSPVQPTMWTLPSLTTLSPSMS